jgi:hypothetical protein
MLREVSQPVGVKVPIIQGDRKNTPLFQVHSYKIKTYWNIFINMGLQIH